MTEATNRSEKALRSLIKSYVADSEQPLALSWVDSLVRQNDALVAALEDAVTWLHLASQNHGTSPLITKQHQVEAAKIEAALEAAK